MVCTVRCIQESLQKIGFGFVSSKDSSEETYFFYIKAKVFFFLSSGSLGGGTHFISHDRTSIHGALRGISLLVVAESSLGACPALP